MKADFSQDEKRKGETRFFNNVCYLVFSGIKDSEKGRPSSKSALCQKARDEILKNENRNLCGYLNLPTSGPQGR